MSLCVCCYCVDCVLVVWWGPRDLTCLMVSLCRFIVWLQTPICNNWLYKCVCVCIHICSYMCLSGYGKGRDFQGECHSLARGA